MPKPILRLLLAWGVFQFNSTSIQAQLIHLGLGYNTAFTRMKGLNEVVTDYNDYRNYLDNELNKFRTMSGMTIQAAAGAGNVFFGFDYSWRRNTNIAQGTYNGADFTRYLRIKQDVFGLSIGGVAGEGNAAFAGGLRMEIYNPKVHTRIRAEGEKKPDWDLANSPFLHASIGPFFKLYFGPKEMWPAGFFVGAQYNYALFKTAMYEVDEYLNGTDYSFLDEPPTRFLSRNNNFSIIFGYGIAITEN